MSDSLTIHCAMSPGDILDVETIRDELWLTITAREDSSVALNRQSAQELYDLLGEFLADDQR